MTCIQLRQRLAASHECVCVGQRQNINYLAVCGSLLAVCGSRLAMYVWVIAGIVRNFVGVTAPL